MVLSTISAGYDGDGNLSVQLRMYFILILLHPRCICFRYWNYFKKPIDSWSSSAHRYVSSYSYDHTVDAGTRRVLDIDAVTARLMARFNHKMLLSFSPVSAATHNGDNY